MPNGILQGGDSYPSLLAGIKGEQFRGQRGLVFSAKGRVYNNILYRAGGTC
jgi:hypothetical protein